MTAASRQASKTPKIPPGGGFFIGIFGGVERATFRLRARIKPTVAPVGFIPARNLKVARSSKSVL